MSLAETKEKKLGKTLDIYRKLAIAINSFPSEETISVKDLAEKAGVHWNTAKKALLFFYKIAPLIPEFDLTSNLRFRVMEKPRAIEAVKGIFQSSEMRILTKMMLTEATEPQKAMRARKLITAEERSVLPDLIEKGYVNSINGKYYLSKRGQAIGSMGIRKIVDLNIPLPWEIQAGAPVHRVGLVSRRPKLLSPNVPKPTYPHPIPLGSEKSKWKNYIS